MSSMDQNVFRFLTSSNKTELIFTKCIVILKILIAIQGLIDWIMIIQLFSPCKSKFSAIHIPDNFFATWVWFDFHTIRSFEIFTLIKWIISHFQNKKRIRLSTCVTNPIRFILSASKLSHSAAHAVVSMWSRSFIYNPVPISSVKHPPHEKVVSLQQN